MAATIAWTPGGTAERATAVIRCSEPTFGLELCSAMSHSVSVLAFSHSEWVNCHPGVLFQYMWHRLTMLPLASYGPEECVTAHLRASNFLFCAEFSRRCFDPELASGLVLRMSPISEHDRRLASPMGELSHAPCIFTGRARAVLSQDAFVVSPDPHGDWTVELHRPTSLCTEELAEVDDDVVLFTEKYDAYFNDMRDMERWCWQFVEPQYVGAPLVWRKVPPKLGEWTVEWEDGEQDRMKVSLITTMTDRKERNMVDRTSKIECVRMHRDLHELLMMPARADPLRTVSVIRECDLVDGALVRASGTGTYISLPDETTGVKQTRFVSCFYVKGTHAKRIYDTLKASSKSPTVSLLAENDAVRFLSPRKRCDTVVVRVRDIFARTDGPLIDETLLGVPGFMNTEVTRLRRGESFYVRLFAERGVGAEHARWVSACAPVVVRAPEFVEDAPREAVEECARRLGIPTTVTVAALNHALRHAPGMAWEAAMKNARETRAVPSKHWWMLTSETAGQLPATSIPRRAAISIAHIYDNMIDAFQARISKGI